MTNEISRSEYNYLFDQNYLLVKQVEELNKEIERKGNIILEIFKVIAEEDAKELAQKVLIATAKFD